MGSGVGVWGLGARARVGVWVGAVSNLVVAGVEELQLRQRRQRRERADPVVLEVQGAQRDGELHAISAHEIVPEAEDGERAELRELDDGVDLVVRELQLLEAREAADALHRGEAVARAVEGEQCHGQGCRERRAAQPVAVDGEVKE